MAVTVIKKIMFVRRVIAAITGACVGISAGGVFKAVLQNIDASVFGYISGVIAILNVILHITYARKRFTYNNKEYLKALMYGGCFVQLCGVVSFIVYLVLGCLYQTETFVVYGRSYFLASIWCLMTWKWGFFLFWYSRQYYRRLAQPEDGTSQPINE